MTSVCPAADLVRYSPLAPLAEAAVQAIQFCAADLECAPRLWPARAATPATVLLHPPQAESRSPARLRMDDQG